MHRPIFGHSFAVLVAPILLSVLAFKFLNKRKANATGNAEDAEAGASGSMTAPTEPNSGGSSSLRAEMDRHNERKAIVLGNAEDADTGASSSMTVPTETNSGGSSPVTGNCYEVFLSFRGPDIRDSFSDHLHHGLHGAGIHVFRDNDELPHGEKIGPELKAAITNSQILIPVLSVAYGTSSWCLDELAEIMELKNEKGRMVLPIFYKVEPAEVRHLKGDFGKAFHEHKERMRERSSLDPTILEKWEEALHEVSGLRGYEANGSEAELVKLIVREVLRELKKKFELVITYNLVGIDSHVSKIMEFVDNNPHGLLFVGIHGMGGIGKTILAKAIYNKLSNQFEHRSFIADMRESSRNGIHHLQKQLINDILKQEIGICNENEGINLMSSRLKDKKILVLLDDVDNVNQVNCMVGNHDWFSSGSIIIITSRDKRVLEAAGVDYNYDLKEMDDNQSLILFSKHAFRKDSPPSEFKDLAHEVVSIIGGLPLSLEVLGSSLCGKKLSFWRGTIDKLRKKPPQQVQAKLMISYEALEHEHKQIFLDIASFFIGTDKRIVSYMWEACNFFPEEGIEVLRFLSLIKIENDHILRMHDQLRDLGREIVCKENQLEPQNRSRLWDYKEAQKVLKENKGTNKIEAINLGGHVCKDFWKTNMAITLIRYYLKDIRREFKQVGDIYTEEQFKNMTCLRFLQMSGAHLSGDFKNSIKKLKWLQWERCPNNFEVNIENVKELVILEMLGSDIDDEWKGWRYFQTAAKLKYLDLSSSLYLEKTDFLSAFKDLEVLILFNCPIQGIDSSIGHMKSLLRLELSYCSKLRELPAEIGELKALEQLFLKNAEGLSALPDSIGSLENLEVLDISYSGIEELPKGIGRLRKLRKLNASHCLNLKGEVMESLRDLSSLQHLAFDRCDNLQSLPHLPSSLTYLHATCGSQRLPSLSHLNHLKELQVHRCKFLECIQEFPSALLKNSEFSQLTNAEESKSPQSLQTPSVLEILMIYSCPSIKTLDVSEFIRLREIIVQSCDNLIGVQGLDQLIYLEELFIRICTSIESLDLPKSTRLKSVTAFQCNNLIKIQGLDRLKFLEELEIFQCTLIESLDLPKSTRLKSVMVFQCENLIKIQGLDRLEFLENLNISECTLIESLDLPKSTRLKSIKAVQCKNLTKIQGLDRLEFLEELHISQCTLIESLELPKSTRLKKIKVVQCKNLAEIQGLDRLEFLERLLIGGTSIERIDLSKTRCLKKLSVLSCKKLAEIQGLDTLEFLKLLDISKCKLLKPIPELPGTEVYNDEYGSDSIDDSLYDFDRDVNIYWEFSTFPNKGI